MFSGSSWSRMWRKTRSHSIKILRGRSPKKKSQLRTPGYNHAHTSVHTRVMYVFHYQCMKCTLLLRYLFYSTIQDIGGMKVVSMVLSHSFSSIENLSNITFRSFNRRVTHFKRSRFQRKTNISKKINICKEVTRYKC